MNESDKKFMRIDVFFKESETILKQSINLKFRKEFTELLSKYFPKWNSASYEFIPTTKIMNGVKKIKSRKINKKNLNKKESKLIDKLKWIQRNYQSLLIVSAVSFSIIYTLITIIGGLK